MSQFKQTPGPENTGCKRDSSKANEPAECAACTALQGTQVRQQDGWQYHMASCTEPEERGVPHSARGKVD